MIDTKYAVSGPVMEEIKREAEYGKEKIQIILQFPEASDETTQIKYEVSAILKRELQKQLKNRKTEKQEGGRDLP